MKTAKVGDGYVTAICSKCSWAIEDGYEITMIVNGDYVAICEHCYEDDKYKEM